MSAIAAIMNALSVSSPMNPPGVPVDGCHGETQKEADGDDPPAPCSVHEAGAVKRRGFGHGPSQQYR